MEATVQPAGPTTATGTNLPIGYAFAAIPDPYRILGLRLRPFSLGHWLLMQRFSCSFATQPNTPTLHHSTTPSAAASRDDCLLGILICSMRHADFLAFIEQKDCFKQITKWGKKVGFIDLKPAAELFAKYLAESLSEPDYVELKPGSGEVAGDWAQNLKITLMTRLGYAEAEALDMPLSKALADYFKLAEADGILRLLTPADRAEAAANSAAFAALDQLSTINPQPGEGEQCPA
ncbi:MAG: hypothetical protein PHQ12_15065 [Chthoniobacteraceae bacterium]|nr:hypothetical protein [Chthoniobacteraceae bacterium]